MILENVISVCSGADIHTWKEAAPRIIKYISSNSYTVIAPNLDAKEFSKCTPSEFNIIPEEEYLTPVFSKLLYQKSEASRSGTARLGWYLQQFLKLLALEKTSDTEVSLIWDADTVPLKNLTFQKDGKILFYRGDEFHYPYFKTIDTLLGLKKTNSFSFIAQCLPCKGSWLRSLQKTIEIKTQKNWADSILEAIDFNETSGFSEYETVGTFIEKNYPNEISILGNRWSRYGNGLIGSVNNLWMTEGLLKKRYDFISFEKWNEPYSRYPGRKMRRRPRRLNP